MKRYLAVDLFSGAGGLSQGLRQAGFRVVGAVELEAVYANTYRLNQPDVKLIQGDIVELDPIESAKVWGVGPGELDLLAACPPCQGFSTIGTRNRPASDSDLRNDLIYQVLRFARALMPRTIMIENVPALAKDQRIDTVRSKLNDLGYVSDLKVLNTEKYGVPQRRKRMIMLASRIGKVRVCDVDLTWGRPRTVRSTLALLDRTDHSSDSLHNYTERRSKRIQKLIASIPVNGGSRSDLPDELVLECHKKTDGFRDVYGRMAWDKPAPTITGGCISPSKGRFLHPEEDRAITLREAALLQTLPLTFSVPEKVSRSSVSIMIGNALPPTFIEFHAKCLRSLLRRNEL